MTPEEIQLLKDSCREMARDAELVAQLCHARLFDLDRAVRPGEHGPALDCGWQAPPGRAGEPTFQGEQPGTARVPGQLSPRDAALLGGLQRILGDRLSPAALAAWLRICWTLSHCRPPVTRERAA
jgi:hypothetical protein